MTEPAACYLCLTTERLSLCGGCQLVHHCPLHQHQARGCPALRVRYDCEIGRYLVASRNIKQGEVIVRDRPAVIGPNMRYVVCF